ncbi:MAG: UbiA-like polyprenyltransferase [bacterium]
MLKKIRYFFEMVKIEHTVFALPFAYVGAIIASNGIPPWKELFFVTLAMFGGRSFAMTWNRIIDRKIDARNSRTSGRHLVTGNLSLTEAVVFCVFSFCVFLFAAFNLAPLAHILWPFFILPMVIYPYVKRFSWLSHFILGLSLALSPIGAFIAVTNKLPNLPVFLIAAGILIWTAGFDIIYACQDYEFDRKEGLYSIPACFGIKNAFWITSGLHFLTVVFFFLAGQLLELGLFYFLGIGIISVFLVYENLIMRKGKLNAAFFKMNGLVSITIFVFTLLDFYL